MQFILPKSLPSFLIFLLLFTLTADSNSIYGKNLREQTTANIAADDLSGEDPVIRKAALEALGTAAGTIVVMNVQTGRVYSIVNQQWAIREGFKPCSTIKLVTGVAGISERLIRKDGDLANGKYRLGLDDALAYSNNTFFQKVGADLGSARMIDYARSLGLGNITGINAKDEFAGKLPYGNENLRIYSHADDFEVTPLQLAVMVSALTNGGKVVIPQIPKSNFSDAKYRGYLRRNLDIAPSLYERVIPGMVGAVSHGTAKGIKDSDLQIAGKTGSCIFDNTWIGLFAAVAPIQNPKFAVVVITRGKYARGKYSAAIAGKIYETLEPRFKGRINTVLAKKTDDAGTRGPKLNGKEKIIVVPSAAKSVATAKDPPEIKNTVITYRRNKINASESAKANVGERTDLIRPRIVQ